MKALKFIFLISIVAVCLGSCTYDFIVPEEVPVINPDDPNAEQISFSSAIAPIFESKCVSCHKTGGQSPDLSSGNAYSSISSTRYLNTSAAEESLIYTKASPDGTGSHPKYSAAEAATVLGWIQQGAKNN
jgi:hypothetical protein